MRAGVVADGTNSQASAAEAKASGLEAEVEQEDGWLHLLYFAIELELGWRTREQERPTSQMGKPLVVLHPAFRRLVPDGAETTQNGSLLGAVVRWQRNLYGATGPVVIGCNSLDLNRTGI